MDKSIKCILLDHICRECGARVVQVTNHGPTGGGNPVFICSLCEQGSASMGPDVICWCGFQMRGQIESAYQCLPFSILKTKPSLLAAFRSCGCDPESGKSVIGIVLKEQLRKAIAES